MQGVAISSYQGGHVEYFEYLVEQLRARGAGHVKVFGGGGGVIVPAEIDALRELAASRSSPPRTASGSAWPAWSTRSSPTATSTWQVRPPSRRACSPATARRPRPRAHRRRDRPLDDGRCSRARSAAAAAASGARVLGITGTGGSGKSSLTDELVRRFRVDQEDKLRIAVLAVDPTRRKGGGALLGDRIRMNALDATATPSSARWPPAAPTRCPSTWPT